MSKSSWRDYARPIISRVIAENKGKPIKEIRAALSAAYPFGERQYHPYRIWLDECAVQLGTKKQKPKNGSAEQIAAADPNQMRML